MSESLGLFESKTLARGIDALDALLKEAPLALALTQTIEPGRFLAVFRGLADDVRQALRRGRGVLQEDLHDELFLPGPHPGVLAALEGAPGPAGAAPQPEEALGLVECASVAAALLAADAGLKEAHVRLAALRFGPDLHGKGLVALLGEVADIESAVSRAAGLAEARGMLVRAAVIPRVEPRVVEAIARGIS